MNHLPLRSASFSTFRAARSDAPSNRRTRVLIIDDHELVRRGLAAVVNAEEDFVCCGEVHCDERALDIVARERPDLIIIDISTREGDGLEIVQRIRNSRTDARIIVLAMNDRAQLVERSYTAGAAAFVSMSGFAERVIEALQRNRSAGIGDIRPEGRPNAGVRGAGLNSTEREIVDLIGRGMPTSTIAIRLGMSVAMVGSYRRRIREKLNSPSATQLVEFCSRWVERVTVQKSEPEIAGTQSVGI